MKKKICTVALVALVCGAPNLSMAVEGEVVMPATVAEVSTVNIVEPVPESGAMLSLDELESTLSQDKSRLELTGKFAWVGYDIKTVSVTKSSPDWGKARAIAIQKAMVATENKIAQELGQKIASDKVSEYFSDANENIADFDLAAENKGSRWERVYDKVMTLTEGQIDSALTELGIEVGDLELVPLEQRKLKFKDAFTSTVTREALAELSGLLTFKTYEGFDESGEYQVAVLMVLSKKMKQLAYDIAHTRGELQAHPKKIGSTQLTDLTTINAVELIPDFGVKRLYDPQGYPVLVSFGQWSLNTTTGDSKKLSRKRAHAYKQAEAQADQAIAEFINSRVNFSTASTTGEMSSDESVVDSTNYKSLESSFSITDVTEELSRKKSRVNVTGMRELRRWSCKHPDNDTATMVGVIRYWSPVNEKQMRAIKNWKPGKPVTKPQTAKAAPAKPEANIKASQERMSLDDF